MYKIKYRYGVLSNGQRVKITEELYWFIREEIDMGALSDMKYTKALDILMCLDNKEINESRNYYLKNVSLDKLKEDGIEFKTNDMSIQEQVTVYSQISDILNKCSKKSRRRFLLHFYYGHSYTEIARIEGVSVSAVRKSIDSVKSSLTYLLNVENK